MLFYWLPRWIVNNGHVIVHKYTIEQSGQHLQEQKRKKEKEIQVFKTERASCVWDKQHLLFVAKVILLLS